MSDKEAVKVLIAHRIRFMDDFGWDKSTAEALDIAIASLATESKPVVKGEWVHRRVWHPLPWDCPPDYGEEYDSESHSRLEDEWHCSNCDYETDVIHKEWWHFCPNCGADMRPRENLKAGAEYADAGLIAPAT